MFFAPTCPLPRIESFIIESSLLFHTRFLSWTLATFRQSSNSLVRLTLRRLKFNSDGWGALLQAIALPVLAELSLGSSTLLFTDLADFLSRHPKISLLDLSNGSLYQANEQGPPLPTNALRGLCGLRASVDYINRILQSEKPDEVRFPELSVVHMEPIMRTPTFSAPDLVSQKPETGPTDRDFQALLSCGIKSPIHLSLTVLGHTFPKWIRLGDTVNQRIERQLYCVTSLELGTFRFHRFDTRTLALIPSWLALFPALSDVILFVLAGKPGGKSKVRAGDQSCLCQYRVSQDWILQSEYPGVA
jgi:hypothetical protein